MLHLIGDCQPWMDSFGTLMFVLSILWRMISLGWLVCKVLWTVLAGLVATSFSAFGSAGLSAGDDFLPFLRVLSV